MGKKVGQSERWLTAFLVSGSIMILGWMTWKNIGTIGSSILLRVFVTILLQVFFIGLVWRSRHAAAAKSKKQQAFPAVSEEVIPFRILLLVFAGFIILFTTSASLMLKKSLPSVCTYELVFGPVILVGIFWFSSLCFQAHREAGAKAAARFFIAFIFMLVLANVVDLTLIKLGAWDFSEQTNLCNVHFPAPMDKTVHGQKIAVPLVEIIGFNGTITWFLFFCGVFLNRLVNPKPAIPVRPRFPNNG